MSDARARCSSYFTSGSLWMKYFQQDVTLMSQRQMKLRLMGSRVLNSRNSDAGDSNECEVTVQRRDNSQKRLRPPHCFNTGLKKVK